jgi:hypothetical protein
MKAIALGIFVFSFSFAVTFASAQQTQTPKPVVNDIILTIGADEIANVARVDIIPKLRFLLQPIPDSLWERFEFQYDSAKIYLDIAKSFTQHFDPKQAQEYYDLAQKLMRERIDTSISKFEYFLERMDSLDILIQQADSMLKHSENIEIELFQKIKPFFKESPYQRYYDSILKSTKPLNLDSLKMLYFPDSLIKNNRLKILYYPDTLVIEFIRPDSIIFRFKPEMDSIFKRYPIDSNLMKFNIKSFIDTSIFYLNSFKELANFYVEYIDSIKAYWNKSINLMKKYFEGAQKQKIKEKDLKELEKQLNKLSKDFEKLIEKLNKKYNKLQQKYDLRPQVESKRPNETIEEYLERYELEFHLPEMKKLIENHKEFIKELLKMKKQIEQDILKELKERGYINE